MIADAAELERRLYTPTLFVERYLRRSRHEREIGLSGADFVKARSDARMRPDGKMHRADAIARHHRGEHRPDEKLVSRHPRAAGWVRDLGLAAQLHRHQRDFGGRIGIRDRTPDRAAATRRRMADPWERLDQ